MDLELRSEDRLHGSMPISDDVRDEGCQRFRSEGAALSYNYMIVLAGLSLPPQTDPLAQPEIDEIDDTVIFVGGRVLYPEMFRIGACSLLNPWLCENYETYMRSVRVQRNTIEAGGNGRFGRRDFQWHEGAPLLVDRIS